MTDQTLNKFYTVATQRGFSRDYQARVSQLTINGVSMSDEDLVYIKNIGIPNKKVAVSTVRYFGADVHSLGTRDFGDSKNWVLTFHTDQILYLKRWFEDRVEQAATNTEVPTSRTARFNVNPVPTQSSYASIDVIDDNLETVVRYKLEGVFVVDVPGINYTLEGTGKVQEFKVTLGYQKWTREDIARSFNAYDGEGTGLVPGAAGAAAAGGGGAGGGGILSGILGGLRTIAGVANTVRGTAVAVRGAATATRAAGRAIRGR